MPLGCEAINLRKPDALSLLYKSWNCAYIVLYVLCAKKKYGRAVGHAILIVFDRNNRTWTPYDPNGRGMYGFVDDEIKDVVQARLDEHWLLSDYSRMPHAKPYETCALVLFRTVG